MFRIQSESRECVGKFLQHQEEQDRLSTKQIQKCGGIISKFWRLCLKNFCRTVHKEIEQYLVQLSVISPYSHWNDCWPKLLPPEARYPKQYGNTVWRCLSCFLFASHFLWNIGFLFAVIAMLRSMQWNSFLSPRDNGKAVSGKLSQVKSQKRVRNV